MNKLFLNLDPVQWNELSHPLQAHTLPLLGTRSLPRLCPGSWLNKDLLKSHHFGGYLKKYINLLWRLPVLPDTHRGMLKLLWSLFPEHWRIMPNYRFTLEPAISVGVNSRRTTIHQFHPLNSLARRLLHYRPDSVPPTTKRIREIIFNCRVLHRLSSHLPATDLTPWLLIYKIPAPSSRMEWLIKSAYKHHQWQRRHLRIDELQYNQWKGQHGKRRIIMPGKKIQKDISQIDLILKP